MKCPTEVQHVSTNVHDAARHDVSAYVHEEVIAYVHNLVTDARVCIAASGSAYSRQKHEVSCMY